MVNNNEIMQNIMQMLSKGENPQNIIKIIKQNSLNPQMVQEMILNQFPNMKILKNQMEQSGLNPIQFSMQLAKQNNMNIQQNTLNDNYNNMLNSVRDINK